MTSYSSVISKGDSKMATANANRDALITGAGNYGIKIAKSGHDVADAEPKDLIFSSSFACAKILQYGKVSAVNASEVDFFYVVQFPILVLSFLYDSSDSKYHPHSVEFDEDKLYFPGGEDSGSYYYYFICYA